MVPNSFHRTTIFPNCSADSSRPTQPLALPADTFPASVIFTITRLDAASTPVVSATDADGQPIEIDPLAAYHLDVADAILEQPATLALEVNVAALTGGGGAQSAFLTALAAGRVMLAVRGDDPKDEYQALALCPSKEPPAVDGCAALELLDQNHNTLPPGSLDPDRLRWTVLVSHFSTFAVALEIPPGGYAT